MKESNIVVFILLFFVDFNYKSFASKHDLIKPYNDAT